MKNTILFLCQRNAAKSLMAAAYFQEYADQMGLDVRVDSAGTQPADKVYPEIEALLKNEGFDFSDYQPRYVTADELMEAAYVVSMGCGLDDLPARPAHFETWDDVPMVSQDLEGAQKSIREHARLFAEKLKGTV